MSFRGAIAKKLLQVFGPEAWNEFWVAFAQRVLDAEKSFKGTGRGAVKAANVKAWAHIRLAPLLPDFSEAAIFGWLDGVLEAIVAKSNELIGQDWVSGVESIEAYVAQIIEPLIDVDLDGDGKISTAAKIGAALLALSTIGFGSPSCAHAQRRPLVEHYRPADAPPPSPDIRPRSEDVKPQSSLPTPTVGTWTGYRSNGRGTGTWDGGVALTLKPGGGRPWTPSVLLGKGGAGLGLAYQRVGALAFWDGSLSAGAYLRAWDW